MDEASMGIGVYIHIPFCRSRCRYCDFYSTTLLDLRSAYVDAVLEEMRSLPTDKQPIRTIYLGGGTPSMLSDRDLERLLTALLPYTQQNAEITLEANPGDLSKERLQAWRRAGYNRLSIGVQAWQDRLLTLIGRRHTATEAARAIEMAQEAGFENISIDLMYGLPNQTMEDWQESMDRTLRMQVQHISCYCLTYEEGTPLYQALQRGEVSEVDEDTANLMYDTLCRQLRQAGYEHYEVSNFALLGYRAQHNSSYWDFTPYYGLGAGAHSYDGTDRWSNPADVHAYVRGVMAHDLQRTYEHLTEEQKQMERIMLGLRTREGIQDIDNDMVDLHLHQGNLRRQDGRLMATQQGLHILNRIIEDLV